MNKGPFSSFSNPVSWGAFKIAGVYLLLGSAWILFSDRVAERIALNKEVLATLSLYKGWGYVIVTALLLYWLIQRHISRLHASEKQLHVVIDALPILISYVGKNQRYQFANEAYEEWFGEKAEGKHIEEVVGQATYQKTSKYIDKVLNGETVSYETEILDHDGGERFVSATYVPDIANNGQVKGFFTLVQDISEQKEAREQLRLWADAFEGCAHGIAIGDPDTNRIVVCNPAFANMLHSRLEDVAGSSILSLYALSDHEHVRNNVERADQIGHTRYEARMLRKDGSDFPAQMDLVSVLGDDGELVYRVATAQDISERKLADDKIIQQARLLEQVNDAVIASDENFVITSWNAGAERIFGWKANEVIGRRSEEFLQTEFFNKTRSEVIQGIKETGEFSSDVTQLRKAGSRVDIEARTVALRDENGHIQGYVSINRDISERKHSENLLHINQEQLRSLINEAPISIAMFDRNMCYIATSQRWVSDYGRGYPDLIGHSHYEVHPDLPDVWKEAHQKGLTGETIKNDDDFWIQKDGTKYWLRWAIVPWHDTEGEIGGIIISTEDITERKRAEEELRKSEERYRYLFQNNPYPMWIYDRKTLAFLDVNEAAITKYGYSHQEFLNMTIVDIRPSQDVEQLMKNLAQPRQPLEQSDGWRHRLKDGTVIPVEITSHTIEIDGHESALVLAQDVTARKRAEAQLERNNYILNEILESIQDDFYVLDRDWNFVYASRLFTSKIGKEPKDFIGKNIWEMFPKHLGTVFEENFREAMEKREVRRFEVGGKYTIAWYRMTAFPSADGITILGTDITERKQIQDALQRAHDELEVKVQERTAALSQANALLQALMDYVPDHIYFKDLECRFIRNSRSQASLLGISDPAQLVGKTDFDFFPHAAKAYAEEQEVMRSGKSLVDFEEWVVWPDGRETWVSTTKVPLRNSEGETIGIFGISRDITERKRIEQDIQQLNSDLEKQAAQLQVANKELEAFSYSVSHDLRAPLRAIDGYTRILVEDYEAILDEEGKRVCGIISAEARRMGQLIDDLLAFSRLGRKEMYSSNIDMKALVVSVLNDLEKEEDRERIDLKIASLPSVKADSSLIRQVWINLLSNAIKFTSKRDRAAIEVGSKSTNDEVIYYVRDTGAGFDMEYANKLFGVFQRLHSESEFEGTGVGLAIVQRIVRRHGGRVWAEGEVDKGATFYFALPQKENHHE